jgi:hypothetical protein
MTVLTFGEALVGYASVEDNLRIATQFVRFPGGAELNVAVGLTRLGVNTTWASVIEEDAHGDSLADTVAQLGIRPLIGLAEGSLLTGASEPYDIAQFCLPRGISELVIKLGAKRRSRLDSRRRGRSIPNIHGHSSRHRRSGRRFCRWLPRGIAHRRAPAATAGSGRRFGCPGHYPAR